MTNAREFTSRLADLLAHERAALSEFLVLLAEFDRKRLWLDLGHASLFSFLHRELGLSKGAAYYRQVAAGLVQRFPEIVAPITDGRLCLTSVVELSKVLTPENRAEVLPRFFHCSKREAAEVAAAIQPDEGAPRREVVTTIRRAAPAPLALAAPDASTSLELAPVLLPVQPAPAVHPEGRPNANSRPPPQQGRESVEPLTAELRRFHVTVSKRFLEKLDAARAALSHSHPGASSEDVLEAGLDLLLAQDARRKGLVEKPPKTPPPANPEHVPAHVKREVWKRDGGRCRWKLESGGICGSTLRVQFDHIVPRALGGASTVENMRLLCMVHNQYAARLTFGDAWMDSLLRDGEPAPQPARPRGREHLV